MKLSGFPNRWYPLTSCDPPKALSQASYAKSLISELGPFALLRCIGIEHVLSLCDTSCLGRFADIGCGRGFLSLFLAKVGLQGIAIDISPQTIHIASNLLTPYPGVNVQFMDLFSLKTDSTFDMVFLIEVLEHMPDDALSLRHIHSLLKQGGYLVLSVPGRQSLYSLWDRHSGHLRRYEAANLVKLLERTGYQVIFLRSWLTVHYYLLCSAGELLLQIDGQNRRNKSALERTKESGQKLFGKRVSPISSSKLFLQMLNAFCLPVFLRLEASVARSTFGPNYLVLARKV